jgi:hypothetical protein
MFKETRGGNTMSEKVRLIRFHNENILDIKIGYLSGEMIETSEDWLGKKKNSYKVKSKPMLMTTRHWLFGAKAFPCYFVYKDAPFTIPLSMKDPKILELKHTSENLNKLINNSLINQLLGNIFSAENLILLVGAGGIGAIIGFLINNFLMPKGK